MVQIDRRLIKNFDWVTLLIVVVIAIVGIMTIYSATRLPFGGKQPLFYLKQVAWFVFGVIALFLVVSFDYKWLSRFSLPLYIVGIVFLAATFVFGRESMGAHRWLSLGAISFQPSEFFKVAYIIILSQQLSTIDKPISATHFFRILFLIVLFPFILLIKQPDLGTALIILTVFVLLALTKGLNKKSVVLFLVICLISLPFLGNILWEGLRDYQKNRFVAFIEPDVDPTGIGYHIRQSKITAGSGGFLGKGYLKGTQGAFRFLPEGHTDFVFAVFAEEWGFLGSLILLSLYLLLILRGVDTAKKARDEFGRLLAIGITLIFSLYFFVNVGMTLGLTPVVGVPLPFMSYGGSALVSNFLLAGILISIRSRRFCLSR